MEENGKVSVDVNNNSNTNNNHNHNGDERGLIWPKLYITLSSKEKEEDFLAMKGCKPPQRPKKRAKFIQRSLLVSLFTFSFFSNCKEIYMYYICNEILLCVIYWFGLNFDLVFSG